MEVCMNAQCELFDVKQGDPGNNWHVHCQFQWSVSDGSTSMAITISVDGVTRGNCVGTIAFFVSRRGRVKSDAERIIRQLNYRRKEREEKRVL
jgi:hypothetical protein